MRREVLVARAKARLRNIGAPRLEMSFILLLTAGTGFLASFSFLHLGLVDMSLRYPLAVLVAYGAFMLYLWLWLRYRQRSLESESGETRRRSSSGDGGRDFSVPDLDFGGFSSGGSSSGGGVSGGGGGFGGGGASARFDAPIGAPFLGPPPAGEISSGSGEGGRGIGDFFSGLDIDDDFAQALILLVVVAVILFLTGYVIYIAPGLLAEVFVDGVLVSGLYRHLKKEDRRHWLATALRKTWWYYLAVAALLFFAGLMMQTWYPEAHSIGDVWQAFNQGG